MKKNKGLAAVAVIAAIIALLFTSCSKPASDTKTFKSLAEKKDYEIYDVTEQYINAPQIKKTIIVAPKDRRFQIEFYLITDLESSKKLFQAQGKVIDSYQGENANSKVSNGKNYAKRTVVTKDNNYLMVSYIENTVIYVPPTSKENREEIEEFIDQLKY